MTPQEIAKPMFEGQPDSAARLLKDLKGWRADLNHRETKAMGGFIKHMEQAHGYRANATSELDELAADYEKLTGTSLDKEE